MTLHHPIGPALTRPADHRHIMQTLDRITGISAVLWSAVAGSLYLEGFFPWGHVLEGSRAGLGDCGGSGLSEAVGELLVETRILRA